MYELDNGYPDEADIDSVLSSLGLEIPVENNPNFYGQFKRFTWGLVNAARWAFTLGVYCPSATTFNVRGGDYTFAGVTKTYAPGSAIDPTDIDTTYIWMEPDNTIGSGIDGDGWPTTEHIKLAEIDVDSDGVITDVRDQRGLVFLKSDSGLILLGSATVDLNAAADTEVGVYTVPTGKVLLLDHVLIFTLSDDAIAAVVTVGKTGGTCDEFAGDQTLSGLDGTTKTGKIVSAQPLGQTVFAAGETVGVEITTPAGAACTAIFAPIGILADA